MHDRTISGTALVSYWTGFAVPASVARGDGGTPPVSKKIVLALDVEKDRVPILVTVSGVAVA
jgi:hypothetical protein